MATFAELNKYYLAYFGRPVDYAGSREWADKTTAQVEAAFAASNESKALYASSSKYDFVNNVYKNVIGRPAELAGLNYWVDQIDSGKITQAGAAIAILNDALLTADKTSVENKLIAGEDFFNAIDTTAEVLAYQGAAAAASARAFIAGVTATPATAEQVKAALAAVGDASAGATGQTFTLTANVDNIQGTSGNDTIVAGEGSAGGVHTLGASDVINGGAGVDTIDIKLVGHQLTPRMSNVEKVFAQALDPVNADAINMVNTTGVQELWSNNSTSILAVTNLQEKATIGVKGGNGSNYTVQAAATARTGDLAIALDTANVGNLFVNSTGAAGGAGYTSTTINAATGTNAITGLAGTGANVIGTLDVGATLATVTVTGDGAVRVTNDLAATVRTIDASANKGGANFNITNNTGNVTFTGGEGADRINFGGTLTLADKVDGGAGRDILGVASQASIVTGLQVSNTEVLELATLNGALNAALVAGVDEVRVTTTLDDVSGTAVVNGLSSNSTFVTNDNGDVRLNITNAQVAGTNDTLNLKTGIAGFGWVNVQAAGVETVAYTQNNLAAAGANTNLAFYDTDGVVDMTKLTLANTAGNTVQANFLVNTIKTVDASAAMGAVQVSVNAGNPTSGVEITGGAGADRLIGGDGKDIIVGGAGNDVISGDQLVVIAGTGGAAIAQQSTVTIANEQVGDQFTVNVNGTPYTVTSGGADAIAQLAAAVGTAGGAIAGAVATSGTVLTLNGLAAGTAFTATASTTNFAGTPAIAETSTVTISDTAAYDAGDVIRVTINGVNFDHTATAGQTSTQVANALVGAINAAGQMAASAVHTPGTSSVITLVGNVAATNYTVTAAMQTEVSAGVAAVPTTVTITPADLETTETLSVTIGTNVYNQVFDTNVATTLGNFVAFNGAAINTLTGGTLSATATDLVITNAAGTGLTGGAVSVAVVGGDGGVGSTVTPVAGSPAVVQTDNADPVFADNAPTAAVPAGAPTETATAATTISAQASGDTYFVGAAAADTLTGGAGNDNFWVLSGSNGLVGTSFTTMDTITDLNLGGATLVLGVDRVVLSAATFAAFGATDLINAGAALTMTGPNLAGAVQALFNAGGALNGSLNDVGLFTYGTDTYLIATDNAAGFQANGDVIVKVTGVTGTLDLSDILLA